MSQDYKQAISLNIIIADKVRRILENNAGTISFSVGTELSGILADSARIEQLLQKRKTEQEAVMDDALNLLSSLNASDNINDSDKLKLRALYNRINALQNDKW